MQFPNFVSSFTRPLVKSPYVVTSLDFNTPPGEILFITTENDYSLTEENGNFLTTEG